MTEKFTTLNGFHTGESKCIQNGVYAETFIKAFINTSEILIPVSRS
jgi:hypothetical protein